MTILGTGLRTYPHVYQSRGLLFVPRPALFLQPWLRRLLHPSGTNPALTWCRWPSQQTAKSQHGSACIKKHGHLYVEATDEFTAKFRDIRHSFTQSCALLHHVLNFTFG